MAVFSSRGPTTPGGQIKPDVVAPGTNILSVRSTNLDQRKESTLRLDPTDTKHQWQFMDGTSMATPLVAGCVAVLREALRDVHKRIEPSSALIKALIVNGAEPLNPTDTPNNNSGFGRVNMVNTLKQVERQPSPPLAGFDERFGANALRHGTSATGARLDRFSLDITVPPPAAGHTNTLAVTLVWPDPSGERLQHFLELSVSHGDEKRFWGVLQRQNNVQQIKWANAPAGVYHVLVEALQILPQPPQAPPPAAGAEQKLPAFQPFAYAWRIFN